MPILRYFNKAKPSEVFIAVANEEKRENCEEYGFNKKRG